MKSSYSLSILRRARLARVATALTLAATVGFGYAQQQQGSGPKKEPHSVGEKTSEAFQKLKPLQDAQDYAGMLKLLEGIPIKPGSYDEALILDMKAKIYAMTNQLGKAIEPWEKAIQLSDQHGYFNEKQTLETVSLLAQLYGAEAATTKDTQKQQQYFSKAITYFRRYLEKTPKPTPETMMAYASILYYKAVADPNKVDDAMIKEARRIVEQGLMTAVKPKEGFYQLLLTLQQQQNDMAGAAEILELLLKQNPAKGKDLWQMLMAMYLQLSEKAKDNPELSRDYLVRAIVTCERAQEKGFLNTPKDNMNLVSLYLMANQFTKGTEILYNGMKKGTIESVPNNWRILGRYYQEANMNDRAVEVLKESTKLFPKNGDLELQIAQLYLQMEKTKEAHEHAKAAVVKGNFETIKPYAVHYLVAYTAYELGDLDGAAAAIAKCEEFRDEAAKDPQLPKLKDVVKEALAEREAKKAPKDAPKKDAPQDAPKKTASR